MSPSSSIDFIAFRSTADPRLHGWVAFRESVQAVVTPIKAVVVRDRNRAGPALAGVPGQSGIWRLLASNSRELGRSSSIYGTFSSARAHVLELKDQCDSMVATVVTGPRAGTHGWVISVGDVVVMTAGRWYGGASTSREASAGTIQAFRSATVRADARHATETGQRGNRVLSDEERAVSW